jgi:hypothetical protein
MLEKVVLPGVGVIMSSIAAPVLAVGLGRGLRPQLVSWQAVHYTYTTPLHRFFVDSVKLDQRKIYISET